MRGAESFVNREDAGCRLAEALQSLPLTKPVVLAIPRGGIEVGAPIARVLGAELDVVLSRKLRDPNQPELALGAVCESGEVVLNDHGHSFGDRGIAYIQDERHRQIAEIERRKLMFRAVRPRASLAGRSVIVTDDGIATGSTMIAALRTVRAAAAKEIIVAVPVAAADRLASIRGLCDRVVCLHESNLFWAIGQFYRDFEQVDDSRVVELLRESMRSYGHERAQRPGDREQR